MQFDATSAQKTGMSMDKQLTGGVSSDPRAQTAQQEDVSGALISKQTSLRQQNPPAKAKSIKKVMNKLKYLSLHDLKVQPQDVKSLFQQLTETDYSKFIEVNLSHFSLNDGIQGTIVDEFCNFLRNQVCLIKLQLSYTQLKTNQLVSITDTIIENDMCLTLQDLNLSYNNANIGNAKVQEQLAFNLCHIIKTGEKLTQLDLSNMSFTDQMNLRIAQTVADLSATIQVFQISHNSTNAITQDTDHLNFGNESAKEILKAFSVPWN